VHTLKKYIRPGLCIVIVLLLPAGALAVSWYPPAISSDSRYVAFESAATNLVPGGTNGYTHIFVRDRQTGTTYLVSKSSAGVEGAGDSRAPCISGDGRYVTFQSVATDLVPGDINGVSDIFVRDRNTGTTTLVSKSSAGVISNGNSFSPFISADGRYVAFQSDGTSLVSGDINGQPDIFVRDRQTGTTTLVSKSSAGVQADVFSYGPSLSADGRYVVFFSGATNLVPGDTNNVYDVFVRDRQTGTTYRVSLSSAGAQGASDSSYPSISPDGRYVAFESLSSTLVTGDTNAKSDIFVRDRNTGTTTLVSKSSAGLQGNDDSGGSSISSGGRYVTFGSDATNLVVVDTNGIADTFVRDRLTGTTYLVSRS
jgi:Tol biopolymer transport system component